MRLPLFTRNSIFNKRQNWGFPMPNRVTGSNKGFHSIDLNRPASKFFSGAERPAEIFNGSSDLNADEIRKNTFLKEGTSEEKVKFHPGYQLEPPKSRLTHIQKEKEKTFKAEEIRQTAISEVRRGRPLVLVFKEKDLEESWEKTSFYTGFDLVFLMEQKSKESSSTLDRSSLFDLSNHTISIFFGVGNSQEIRFKPADLKEVDEEGDLLYAILRINGPGALRSTETEGIGLAAACMQAGYLRSTPEEAKNLLRSLSSANRKESLRHALIFSCQLNNLALVEGLLQLEADANIASEDDASTPLEIAMDHDNLQMAEVLLKFGADSEGQYPQGVNCRAAAKWQDLVEFSSLFDKYLKSP
jgi:hypothetical protein